MGDVTQILRAIERCETQAAEELIPMVYDELRRQRLAAGGYAARVELDEVDVDTRLDNSLAARHYLELGTTAVV